MTNPTHVAITSGYAALAVGTEAECAEAAKAQRYARAVALADLDVAELAAIAKRDQPALARRGAGLLGAGTHPAAPYLEAMVSMRGVNRSNVREVAWGYDNAADIVNRFVGEARTWRGDTARAVKAALREMIAA